jgi:2-iminoacetate synthase ThiH
VIMPRRPAQITQAEVARIIRAAKQAGASEVVVKFGEQSVVVRLDQSTAPEKPLEKEEEIVL